MKAILINKTDDAGHHGCTLVNRQIDLLSKAHGIDIVRKHSLSSEWIQHPDHEYDAILVNGEGTLHDCAKGAVQISSIPGFAIANRKKAFLFNTVYQNNDIDIAHKVAKYDLIFVRDLLSKKELEKFGITSTFVPDLTLSWNTPKATGHGNTIVNGSTLKDVRKTLYGISDIETPYLPIIGRPIDNKKREKKFNQRRWRSLFAAPGIGRTRHRKAIPEFDDFIDHLRFKTSGVITGRFHMVTISLCLEIPFLAVRSNTHKIEALLSDLNLTHRLIPVSDVKQARKNIPPFTDTELNAIREYISFSKKAANDCFSTISSYAL